MVLRPEHRKEADASVLAAILELTSNKGYAPTYRELGTRLGISHSAIHLRMRRLSQAGLVHEDPHIARTLRVTPAGRRHIWKQRRAGDLKTRDAVSAS